MTTQKRAVLLGPDDPAPVTLFNAAGRSPFLLIGDHAGVAIPAALGSLGLTQADLARHIACDIGVRGMGLALAADLDAVFIHQHYSRLVIDCNRDPLSPDAVPVISDGIIIKQNQYVDRESRIAEIHQPYQQAIGTHVGSLTQTVVPISAPVTGPITAPVILVSLHSFTPVMAGVARPWHVGILHGGGDEAFALAVLRELRRIDGIVVGDNEPYRMDATDHTVPRHAFPVGLPYVEIEVRQDLIADAAGQRAWADILGPVLVAAQHIRKQAEFPRHFAVMLL